VGMRNWGYGIDNCASGPIPNPQSPIPNTQSPIPNLFLLKLKNLKIIIFNNLYKN